MVKKMENLGKRINVRLIFVRPIFASQRYI